MTITPSNPPVTPSPAEKVSPAQVADILFREVQMMQAAGWTLLQRWPGGADFQSVSPRSISTGMHALLLLLTAFLWLLVMPFVNGGGQYKWCRLTIDEHGQPHYEEIGRPKR